MIITVDTGATKTLLGRFTDSGGLQETFRFPTPHSRHEYVSLLTKSLKEFIGQRTPKILCIALPGAVDAHGVFLRAGNLNWKGLELREALSREFSCPILVENDANLAAIAEIRSLDAIPRIGMYLTVSTGIGIGVVTDGKLNQYLSQSEAGLIGLEHNGTIQTWESFASGQAVYKTYKRYGSDIHDEKVWLAIAKNIAVGLAAVLPIINPEKVVIGGSMGDHFPKYERLLVDTLREIIPHQALPDFSEAAHPDKAVLYGCYHYASDYIADSHT